MDHKINQLGKTCSGDYKLHHGPQLYNQHQHLGVKNRAHICSKDTWNIKEVEDPSV